MERNVYSTSMDVSVHSPFCIGAPDEAGAASLARSTPAAGLAGSSQPSETHCRDGRVLSCGDASSRRPRSTAS